MSTCGALLAGARAAPFPFPGPALPCPVVPCPALDGFCLTGCASPAVRVCEPRAMCVLVSVHVARAVRLLPGMSLLLACLHSLLFASDPLPRQGRRHACHTIYFNKKTLNTIASYVRIAFYKLCSR
jgi:hypothetical protein